MSDASYNSPFSFDDYPNLDLHSPFRSSEVESIADTPTMENIPEVIAIDADCGDATEAMHPATAGVEQADTNNNEDSEPFTKKKRKTTSVIWDHFVGATLEDGTDARQCIHCLEKIKKYSGGPTTPYHRHINDCKKLKVVKKGQLNLKVSPGSSCKVETWKFSNARMREVISHMIMIHELPFNFVEYELFNVVMMECNPAFEKITRATIRKDCISSYGIGKERIKKLLKSANRVSITTDMWTSRQNKHYMVVTGHFVDSDFTLHKYILSFVNVPPPYTGICIHDVLFKCLKEWKIETKVATLTVDNASTNDVAARMLRNNLKDQNQLILGGKFFHVRCCAHILNLLVQDGLSKIGGIIHNVRESVKHVNASSGRLHVFSELCTQLSMPRKHLILDVSTRWNATYAMLSTALVFKEVFVHYRDRETTYTTLPTELDWKKVEDVCSFLGIFNEATTIISGSEYPTSNLFFGELYGIKQALDSVALDGSDYMKAMGATMKEKYDKYWGASNMLIKIAAVLDPRYKLTLLNFTFKAIYSQEETADKIQDVKDTLDDMYKEYVEAHKTTNVGSSSRTTGVDESTTSKSGSSFPTSRFGKGFKTNMANYDQHIRSSEAFLSDTSELTTYLDEGVYIGRPGELFNVLGWWKEKSTKYRILSKMASDILAIPVTTVASESAFSAGGRVIDPHRASLGTEMVEMLICGSDWYRHYYGLHKQKNKESDIIIIELP